MEVRRSLRVPLLWRHRLQPIFPSPARWWAMPSLLTQCIVRFRGRAGSCSRCIQSLEVIRTQIRCFRLSWGQFVCLSCHAAAALVCFLIASGQFYQPALNGPAYVRARSRHARLNYLGFACVVVSMAGILIHRIRLNKSLIPHAWHTWVGAFVCVWVRC